MEPANIRFGGGSAETMLHPLIAIVMLVAIGFIFLLPRRSIVVPLLLTAFLVPLGQVVVVAGVHFPVLRIITLFGVARLFRSRLSSQIGPLTGGFNSVDKAFSLWAFFYALNFVLMWMETQALIQRVGFLLDVFGMYFLLRFLIQNDEDMLRVIKLLAIVAVVIALSMIGEQLTRQNIFGLVGGVRSVPEMREGRIRSQGVFQHPLLAGAFGATLFPLFVGLWEDRKSRIAVIVGMISSTLITLTTVTSTPLLTYAAGILALCLWPFRRQMRLIRWGIALMLLGLHFVMKAPVWALIGRIDVTGSSSSYQRYALVDNFIRHFGDWWLLGAKNYNQWGWDMWDLSNQYVGYGLAGGLVTLVFFIAIISRSFGKLGTARKFVEGDRKQEWFLWSLGAALFAHVVAYFGTGYWDQTAVAWYALLALISTATYAAKQSPAADVAGVGRLWGGKSRPPSPMPEPSGYPAATPMK